MLEHGNMAWYRIIARGLAGHSHYHNVRHRKARVDAKRQLTFQKLSREIYAAIKAGGSADPKNNARLGHALEAARKRCMPKERIERALQTGACTASEDTVVFEGVFPGGVGVLVRASGQRRNAVAGELRALFSRGGGEMGRASWLFVEKHAVVVPNGKEDVALFAMEQGADDVEILDDHVEVFCDSNGERERIRKGIVEQFGDDGIYGVKRTEARTEVKVGGERCEKLSGLLEALDGHSEVIEVIHNADLR